MLFDGEKRLAHQREKHRCVCERHIGGDERGVPSPDAKPYLIQRGGQYCDQERKRLEKTREKSRREKEYRRASERQTAKRIGEESGRNRSRSAGDASEHEQERRLRSEYGRREVLRGGKRQQTCEGRQYLDEFSFHGV